MGIDKILKGKSKQSILDDILTSNNINAPFLFNYSSSPHFSDLAILVRNHFNNTNVSGLIDAFSSGKSLNFNNSQQKDTFIAILNLIEYKPKGKIIMYLFEDSYRTICYILVDKVGWFTSFIRFLTRPFA